MMKLRKKRYSASSDEVQSAEDKMRELRNLKNSVDEVNKTRLDLLSKICGNVRTAKEELPIMSSITQMTRYALNASASLLLLSSQNKKSLPFKYTDGPLGKKFKQLEISKQAGIAGFVMQSGKPFIIKDISKDERFDKFKDEVPGLETRSVVCAPLVIDGVVVGVIEALNKLDGNEFNEHDLLTMMRLAGSAAPTIENFRANQRLLYSYKGTIQKLVYSLDPREAAQSKCSKRVSEYALFGTKGLSLSDDEKQNIEYAAILRDIGLLSIPASVLNKRNTLTPEEWKLIRQHPVLGYNLLRGIPSLNQVSKLVLYHHERYDGKGYPCGLRGENIPLGARLIAVAEAFDSMTVKHAYREPMDEKDAVMEILRCAGSQFCPVATRAFSEGIIHAHSLKGITIKTRS